MAHLLKQKLSGRLSSRQIQLMKMITLPITDIEQRIKEELEENPALEEGSANDTLLDDPNSATDEEGNPIPSSDELLLGDYASEEEIPDYMLHQAERTPSSPSIADLPYAIEQEGLQEYLEGQLALTPLNEHEQAVGRFIIGSLDDDGLLRRTPEGMLDDLAIYFSIETSLPEIERVEAMLRTLDPPGIAARSLQQTLSIQLHRLYTDHVAYPIAVQVVDFHLDLLASRSYSRLQELTGATTEQLREAITLITRLSPTPGAGFDSHLSDTLRVVIPDFYVYEDDSGELVVSLNSSDVPEVRVSREFTSQMSYYTQDLRKLREADKEAARFVKQKLDEARWFVEMLYQRNLTLLETMTAIVERQRNFFLTGDVAQLRPMILKDIAEVLGYDVSTISRATSGKYVQTPWQIYPLRFFFSEGATTTDGEEVSTHRVRELLTQLVEGEDKQTPLTDSQLVELLQQEGFSVARRTVAKYREALGIPIARLRKQL